MNLAAYEAGVLVPAGVSKTVGAAGGFVLGGGHGPLAPLLGLAADSKFNRALCSSFAHPVLPFSDVLEFTLVIANGSIITASRHSNPSLFESLLGGGASSYGVILETIFKTSPIPDGFVGIFGTFAVNSDAEKEKGDESWNRLIKGWIDLQPQLSDAGPFAGYTYVVRYPTLSSARKALMKSAVSNRDDHFPLLSPTSSLLPISHSLVNNSIHSSNPSKPIHRSRSIITITRLQPGSSSGMEVSPCSFSPESHCSRIDFELDLYPQSLPKHFIHSTK